MNKRILFATFSNKREIDKIYYVYMACTFHVKNPCERLHFLFEENQQNLRLHITFIATSS